MQWLELILDIAILALLVGLLFELRRSKKPGFSQTLEDELQKASVLKEDGGPNPKGPQDDRIQNKKTGESQEYEKAYELVAEMLEKGYSIQKIVSEVKLIPEQEVRLIARLKRPRRVV
jgi:hypothetical protein